MKFKHCSKYSYETVSKGWEFFDKNASAGDPTRQYVEKVLSGEQRTNKAIQLLVQNLLAEQVIDDFKYKYSEKHASHAVDFVENFCTITKGSAGRLILPDWQKYIVASLFGWVSKETGLRRFKQALVFVARKNGKTLLMSAIAEYMLIADGEVGAEVYCLANTRQQAGILFDNTKQMIYSHKSISKHVKTLRDSIHFKALNSKFEPRASDSSSLDGLNTHLGIFDEIHEFKDFKLIDVIESSMGARKQPMLVFITTAGFVLTGALISYYERGHALLKGDDDFKDNGREFYFLAELDEGDDVGDDSVWIKANPNLGISLDIEELREQYDSMMSVPERRVEFLTKRLNKFVEWSDKSFIDYPTVLKNNGTYDEKLLYGKECVCGIDASVSGDLTSVVFEFDIDGIIYLKEFTFIPRTKITVKNSDTIDYAELLANGEVIIAGENSIDKTIVYQTIMDYSKKVHVLQINYDASFAQELIAMLRRHFACLEIRQGHRTLSDPMSDMKELLLHGQVNYNKKRILTWYMTNVEERRDVNDNIAPDKRNAHRGAKIDGFSAWLNAHVTTFERRINRTHNVIDGRTRIIKF